jgi:NhaP-type Na+/H+ or K+/H+ antiporter
LFSAVISATDFVAALTFIKEERESKLFAILFGEGVINDAVCIVLDGLFKEFLTSSDEVIFINV